jgi:lipopolysaccharide export system protein LptA
VQAVCAAAFLLALFVADAFAQAPTWGAVRMVEQPLSVRHQPDPAAPIVRTLRPGDKVRVDFPQVNGFAAVFDPVEPARDVTKAIGFVEMRLLGPIVPAGEEKSPAKGTPRRPAKPAPDKVVAEKSAAEAAVPEKSAPAKASPDKPLTDKAVAEKPVATKPVVEKAVQKPVVEPLPKTAPSPQGHSSPTPEIKSEVLRQPAQSATPAANSAPQDPVRITSDKMVYSQTENAVIFMGNVHGTQKDMAIWAAKVTAYFSEKKKDKAEGKGQDSAPGEFGDKIERIVAEGSVRLAAGKNEGACSTLTYFVADNIVRMEGNPILREGQNTVRGDVIKFYVKENRSEVLSGSKRRVEAVFFSPAGGKK